MDIITVSEVQSRTFIIQPGKQITLYATGLVDDDRVIVEMLHLSRAPDWGSDLCCNMAQADIEILAAVPLKCADGNEVVMTAEYPWVTIDAPQNVPLRVRVEADAAALVTVELQITESDGCMTCTCRCYDTVWTDTGATRCSSDNVEAEQKSNCGTTRWVVVGPKTWTPTGVTRCVNGNVEQQEANDCGDLRWTVVGPQTWTATGERRCVDGNVEQQEVNACGDIRWTVVGPYTWLATGDERCVGGNVERKEVNNCCCESRWVVDRVQTWTATGEERCVNGNVERREVNDCGDLRWVVNRAQTWIPTGDSRCENNLLENQEANDCGTLRWVATTEVCGYCPSSPVPLNQCDGQSAYAYRDGDAKDPAATVEISSCAGEEPSVWIYPSAAPGHSIPVYDCDRTLLGYGANTSDCVSNEVSRIEILSATELKIEPLDIASLPELKISKVPEFVIARHLVEAVQVGNEIWKYWSDGSKEVEAISVAPTTVVYCPSLRLSCSGEPGFGFHVNDPKDPAATVEMAPCTGDTSVDSVWIYPSAGTGHTVKVTDCDGAVIGYAANTSSCAPDCGCPETSVVVNVPQTPAPSVVVNMPQNDTSIWTPTEVIRCANGNIEQQEVTAAGGKRWTVIGVQTWVDTAVTRCENNLVEQQQINDCGIVRWVATTEVCGYCPSLRVSCSGESGFGFHINDPKDPAATVEMAPCTGDTSVDSVWIYPSAGAGHTLKVTDCDGAVIGYAANTSSCAGDCGCPETNVNVTNEVTAATPSVTVSNTVPTPSVTVNNQIPAPATVASIAYQGDNLVITMTDGTTRTAGPNFCP